MPVIDKISGFLLRLVERIDEFLLGKEEIPVMPPPVERKPQVSLPPLPNIQLPQVDPLLLLLVCGIAVSVAYVTYVQYISRRLRAGEALPPYEGEEEENREKKQDRVGNGIRRLFRVTSPEYTKGEEEERLLEEIKGKGRETQQVVSIAEVMGRISQVIEDGVREATEEMKEEGFTAGRKRRKVDVEKAKAEVEEMLANTPIFTGDAIRDLTPEEEQLIAERTGAPMSDIRNKKRGKRGKHIDEDVEDAIFEEEAEEEDKAEDIGR